MLRQFYRTMSFIMRHPISGRMPIRSLLRYGNYQIRSRMRSELEVAWIQGSKLVTNAGMTGASGNIYCGLHEYPEMALTLHLLRQGDFFCDIGANIGSYSILASKVVGAQTLSIEAAPETVIRLRCNIAANHVEHLVDVRNVLVGRSKGTTLFTTGRDTVNRVATQEDPDVRALPMSTLDELLHGICPVLIKIDVEGYEEEVFAGAQRTLDDERLQVICTELYSPVIADELQRRGFNRVYYDPKTRKLGAQPNAVSHSNALLVRNLEWAQRRVCEAPKVNVLGVDI